MDTSRRPLQYYYFISLPLGGQKGDDLVTPTWRSHPRFLVICTLIGNNWGRKMWGHPGSGHMDCLSRSHVITVLFWILGYGTSSSKRVCDSAGLDKPGFTASHGDEDTLQESSATSTPAWFPREGPIGLSFLVSLYSPLEELEFQLIPQPSLLAWGDTGQCELKKSSWGHPSWNQQPLSGQGREKWLSLLRMEKGPSKYLGADC